ncbi:fork head domain-containing protein [Gongronella butleri]|nr:fork head domain-containing protein [Gongronella butleri]
MDIVEKERVAEKSAGSSTTGVSLPSIPVALRHPRVISSVKQYRSDQQHQQLAQPFISEAFISMVPNATKQPRQRRRPPFSYSSLIAQAILGSEGQRMTLREIYRWIAQKYPALYNANDTGWQNTIRHNLSLNRCFKKVPKSEMEGHGKGKGGYWTIDSAHMAKFKNGAFARGSSSTLRRTPANPSPQQQANSSSSIPAQSFTPSPGSSPASSSAESMPSPMDNTFMPSPISIPASSSMQPTASILPPPLALSPLMRVRSPPAIARPLPPPMAPSASFSTPQHIVAPAASPLPPKPPPLRSSYTSPRHSVSCSSSSSPVFASSSSAAVMNIHNLLN